jgi:xylan 1,4-beta-xylosidase
MAPVEWKDGWPIINPNFEEVQYSYSIAAAINPELEKLSGNYFF